MMGVVIQYSYEVVIKTLELPVLSLLRAISVSILARSMNVCPCHMISLHEEHNMDA